jgi:hypothetical protein
MLSSKDGLIHVDQTNDLSKIVFPQAAWSVINIPTDEAEARDLQERLYNSFSSRHLVLGLFRHKKNEKPAALRNIKSLFHIYDYITLSYEKATGSSNGLLSLSEWAVILYKGQSPDGEKTQWFAEAGHRAAANIWALGQQEHEPFAPTYQRFSWEANLMMLSLAKPLETVKFIYATGWQQSELPSIFGFCQAHNVSVQLYTKTIEEAKKVITLYEGKQNG